MVKLKFHVLCFVLAAALLCGCGPTTRIDDPSAEEGEPSPPAPTPVQTADPTSAPTPDPTAIAFAATPMEGDTDYTFGGTTYAITVECCDDDDWPTTQLSAKEDNGRESAAAYDGYFVSAYYCETGSLPCILLTTDIGVSESVTTYVLDARSLAETDSAGGSIQSINDGVIRISCHVDMLGTYSAIRDYTLSSDLALKPAGEGVYRIAENDYFLVTNRKLPVQIDENGQYRDETLDVGTELRVTATDAKSIVYFKTRDNRAGRLAVTVQDWVVLIDGVPAEEWFMELPYAG